LVFEDEDTTMALVYDDGDEEVAVQWQRDPVVVSAVKTVGGTSRRWQCHPRDRTRVRSGVAARVKLVVEP
jgi:hypothetical protein